MNQLHYHLGGPFYIHGFSLMLALALVIFSWLVWHALNKRRLITRHDFISLVTEASLAGIFGARMMHVLSEWGDYIQAPWQIFALWQGGLSVIGGVLGVLGYSAYFLHSHHLPLLPILDTAALYAPLAHAIARIGCLLSGCCFGAPMENSSCWSISYTGYGETGVPFDVPVYPTQLYSALIFVVFFLILNYVLAKRSLPSGTLLYTYLLMLAGERFIVDFWRGDRIMTDCCTLLSVQQVIAVIFAIFVCATYVFILRSNRGHTSREKKH